MLGNHDNPRIASRIGRDQARVAAMLLLTLRGTPTLYYGDELGMHNVPIPPDRVQDPFEKNVPGLGLGRDPSRTPMQWSADDNAGFTAATPWLPIADDIERHKCPAQKNEPRSMLSLYRRLIELRRQEPALSVGEYTAMPCTGDVIAYRRHLPEERQFFVALNLGTEPATIEASRDPLHGTSALRGKIALSTGLDREGEIVNKSVQLSGGEGVMIALVDE